MNTYSSRWISVFCFFILLKLPKIFCINNFDLHMPGVKTEEEDAYICTILPVPELSKTIFITDIIPKVNLSVVHHIILKGCAEKVEASGHISECNQCKTHIYIWAMRAPSLHLPVGVGIPIGKGTNIVAFELEVHYLPVVRYPDFSGVNVKVTTTVQPKVAGIYILLSNEAKIPGGKSKVTVDVSCQIPTTYPITVIGIRSHTHNLGRSVVGYRLAQGKLPAQRIGRVNPQWPQSFYPLDKIEASFRAVDLSDDDVIMARCVYNSRSRNRTTVIGSTHHDEMCNLYLLYYSNPSNHISGEFPFCYQNKFPQKWQWIPEDSINDAPQSLPTIANSSSLLDPSNSLSVPEVSFAGELSIYNVQLGQVSGLATASRTANPDNYELLVLHRGRNIWDASSFDQYNVYRFPNNFIKTNPVLHVDPFMGKILHEWGQNLFILPHGLTVENQYPANLGVSSPKAIWITDVALHQVFKFDWDHWDHPSLVLGIANRPGRNQSQFCKPTDVAISSKGDIFVADGYCNSRIVKFTPDGKYVKEWSALGIEHPHQSQVDISEWGLTNFQVAHSLTILPEEDGNLEQVCVADRENAIVLCYTLDGVLVSRYSNIALKPSVYAIRYDPVHRFIVGITGPSNDFQFDGALSGINISTPIGFFLSPRKPKSLEDVKSLDPLSSENRAISPLIGFFANSNLQSAHALTLSSDSRHIFIAQMNPNRIYQFDLLPRFDEASSIVTAKSVNINQFWSVGHLKTPHLIGISFVLILILFISSIIWIRLCWCGHQTGSRSNRHKITKISDFAAHLGGSQYKARKAGFRPLIKDGDISDFEEAEDDEEDFMNEDVIVESNGKHTNVVALNSASNIKSNTHKLVELVPSKNNIKINHPNGNVNNVA